MKSKKTKKMTRLERKLTSELAENCKKFDTLHYENLILKRKLEELEKQQISWTKSNEELTELDTEIRRTIGLYSKEAQKEMYQDEVGRKYYRHNIIAFIGHICGQNAAYKEILHGQEVPITDNKKEAQVDEFDA